MSYSSLGTLDPLQQNCTNGGLHGGLHVAAFLLLDSVMTRCPVSTCLSLASAILCCGRRFYVRSAKHGAL